MRLAMDRDSIAREYTTNFEITFTVGSPALERSMIASGDAEASIVQTYLTLLSRLPDSLIARKCGDRKAKRVSQQAGAILAEGGAFTQEGRRRLTSWDRTLRKRGNRLNPGTTADLTAAALFAVMLQEGVEFVLKNPGKSSTGRQLRGGR
jgi:triphosphoribosyl-dephospho-CoA synthase